ncbi:hypothetical protein [Planosporangium mesophilum]|uniref:STAS domain-containing protein n=1 Tax=Planosporangium mesophilum TaxID=689768 RepID=A0A8J3TJK1_9ACTN|nr:hypothetical protein [Planosporangium mesophilum]NJC83143.1 hypothetical protein [Planosporangium mesophilum]GII22560.1 hypothetical protein Pme01_21570 [Planosporangium mesophilum]
MPSFDRRGLDFIDSAGIGALVTARSISAQVGVPRRLTAVSVVTARVLGVLGVDLMRGPPPARIGTAAPVDAAWPPSTVASTIRPRPMWKPAEAAAGRTRRCDICKILGAFIDDERSVNRPG